MINGCTKNILLNQVQFDNIEEMNKELTELANTVDWDEVKKEEEEYGKFLENEVEIDLIAYDENDMFDGIDEKHFDYLLDVGIWKI